MHGFETHFQLLELDQTASLDEIRQAYKDLVMVWHPDRFAHNARLREKAEDKLKQFNCAYESLKQWYAHPKQERSRKPPKASSPSSAKSSSQEKQGWSSHDSSSPPPVQASELYITFAHAEYVLQRYCFKPLKTTHPPHHEYQSGPFFLLICDEPLELTLSVPCHSLQEFDRILLSIPCKSTGHFYQNEAQCLLELMHHHSRL